MERYLIAWEKYDNYNGEDEEILDVKNNKSDVVNLVSNIISNSNDRLLSIVHYDFIRHTSKVLKVTLNSKLKLDLEEEK